MKAIFVLMAMMASGPAFAAPSAMPMDAASSSMAALAALNSGTSCAVSSIYFTCNDGRAQSAPGCSISCSSGKQAVCYEPRVYPALCTYMAGECRCY